MTPDAAKAAVQRLKEDEPKKSRSTSNEIIDYASFGGIHRKTKKNDIIITIKFNIIFQSTSE